MPQHSPLDLPEDDPFGPHHLPYGVFSTPGALPDGTPGTDPDGTPEPQAQRKIGVRYGGYVLDAGAAAASLGSPYAGLLAWPTLNPLLAAGLPAWRAVRSEIRSWLTEPVHRRAVEPLLHPLSTVALHLPFEVADYVDFYASEHHATNAGRILRPDGETLAPNWKHLPVGYHGRAGTVVPSGTPVRRPVGQRPGGEFGPSARLDIELEAGFVIGTPSTMGEPVPIDRALDHVFGMVLVNDWSARDIQAWEYQPLGPFLSKNFASTISPWIITLEALAPYRLAWTRSEGDPQPLAYLDSPDTRERGAIDIQLEVALETEAMGRERHPAARLACTSFKHSYWTVSQMVTHHTVNGCSLKPGDLLGSGTESGPTPEEAGSLLELTVGGKQPVQLPNGETRSFLENGDTVVLRAWCEKPGFVRIGFGECRSTVLPAIPW
jgi:fumarylacetoacetase